MLAPPLHQGDAALNILGAVVGIADLIFSYMCKGGFNDFRIEALLVQRRAGKCPQAMGNQLLFKPHPFQRHIGCLGMSMASGVSVRGKDEFASAADGFHQFQQLKCLGG